MGKKMRGWCKLSIEGFGKRADGMAQLVAVVLTLDEKAGRSECVQQVVGGLAAQAKAVADLLGREPVAGFADLQKDCEAAGHRLHASLRLLFFTGLTI
jgi:hypothetical protein